MEISSDEDDFVDNKGYNNPIIKTKISNDEDDFVDNNNPIIKTKPG